MHQYWNSIIRHFFERVRPHTVIEIGVERGENTKNIVSYCEENTAVVHAIDPSPEINPREWEQKHSNTLFLHTDLSLNVLGTLPASDAVLIDGDHNWYTVLSELQLLQKTAQCVEGFPIVFLHDVQWPYGRRDSYYNPSAIPDVYRQPYAQEGIPVSPDSLHTETINDHVYNALEEHTEKNGVKTAIEDFLKDCTWNLHYREIDGMHGLGILMTDRHMQMCSPLVSALTVSSHIHHHIHTIESDRCETHAHLQRADLWLSQLEKSHTMIQQSYLGLREEHSKNTKSLAELQYCQQKIVELEHKNATLHTEIQRILHTLSWRSTKILRLFGSFIRTYIRHK